MFKVVQKFGGTSVGDVNKIKRIAEIIARERVKGSAVVAVVSAMSGVTDQLVQYTREIKAAVTPEELAEYDAIIASGEQITAGLLALALQAIGIKSRSFLGWQLPIVTDSAFSNGRIMSVGTELINKSLKNNEVPVISGFQGVYNERIVTLGRGGSDTTATAVAAAICADRCDIFTDVEGVFTADPCIVQNAQKIEIISYEQMLTMASSGAKVIHPRAVDISLRHNIETQVLSSFIDVPGTILVKENRGLERGAVLAVVSDDSIVLLTICNLSNNNIILEHLFNAFTEAAISTEIVIEQDVSQKLNVKLMFSKSNLDLVKGILKNQQLIEKSIINEKVAKITIVGNGLTENSIIMQKVFQIFLERDINILGANAIDTKVSVIVGHGAKYTATIALHKGFDLE